jgi:hypothetical protein
MSTDREKEHRRRSADSLYEHGRQALRDGHRARARQLLEQAVDYNREHSEAWLWLSATTDDPEEQKKFLEWAVAANPGNAAAKRGLGILTGKIKKHDLLKEGETLAPRQPAAPEPAQVRRDFKCPQCGGALRFDPALVDLKCEHCGYVEVVEEESAAELEQVLDFNLGTRQGHRWAEGERRFTCRQCSATTLLGVGQTSGQCVFCGSAALVAAPEETELLPVQGVIPMGFEAAQAQQHFQAWLGKGFFDPDDLKHLAGRAGFHPAYVPFWTFNATVNAHWRGQVSEGHGKNQKWVWRTGERISFYTNHLVCGFKALPSKLVRALSNYTLRGLVRYKPEYLAQWPAALYDLSLADASLIAREQMLALAQKELEIKAGGGKQVINLEITGSDFSGQTYKLVLLPLWIGAYTYQNKTYRVLINGQTGKVAGDKPRDAIKIALVVGIGLLTVVVVALLIYGAWALQRGA